MVNCGTIPFICYGHHLPTAFCKRFTFCDTLNPLHHPDRNILFFQVFEDAGLPSFPANAAFLISPKRTLNGYGSDIIDSNNTVFQFVHHAKPSAQVVCIAVSSKAVSRTIRFFNHFLLILKSVEGKLSTIPIVHFNEFSNLYKFILACFDP